MNIPPLQQPYQQYLNTNNDAPERETRNKRSVADTSTLWPNGSTINVALDVHGKNNRGLVVDAIREWAPNTPGLRFNITDGKQGDIRISDDEGIKGNWSAIGTEANKIDKDQPTLHLNRTNDSKAFRQTSAHEFGHALGLLHEHQHPDNTAGWNKQAVYDTYSNEQSDTYDKEKCDNLIKEQFFDTHSGPKFQITPYDDKSIMHYDVSGDLRTNGQEIPPNTYLSNGDREAVRRLYPAKT